MGLLCPSVVRGTKEHGRRRHQAPLAQPADEGARVGDELRGIHLEQTQADTPGPPARTGTPQVQARLADGQAVFGHLATAAMGPR